MAPRSRPCPQEKVEEARRRTRAGAIIFKARGFIDSLARIKIIFPVNSQLGPVNSNPHTKGKMRAKIT
jgi:hypothetical protein